MMKIYLSYIVFNCVIPGFRCMIPSAPSILPSGRTEHSRFKIPLNIEDLTICNISKQSTLAKLLQIAKIIIWDEAPMSKRQCMEYLDKMLQVINNCNILFNGKVIVIGSDFRQVTLIVPKAIKEEIIDARFLKSSLWTKFQKIRLIQNMRAQEDPVFSEYLRIGIDLEKKLLQQLC